MLKRIIAGGCLLTGLVSAAPGTLTRDTELKEQAWLDASKIDSVNRGDTVDVLGTHGGWMQVKTAAGKTGWVRMLYVRLATSGKGNSLAGLSSLGNVLRTGSTGSTATTGAKGFNKEELEAAQPNFAEVDRLLGYQAKPAGAKQFAQNGGLKARSAEELTATSSKKNNRCDGRHPEAC